jgi:hypothetical protein
MSCILTRSTHDKHFLCLQYGRRSCQYGCGMPLVFDKTYFSSDTTPTTENLDQTLELFFSYHVETKSLRRRNSY